MKTVNYHSEFAYLDGVLSLDGLPENRQRDFANLRQLLTSGGGTVTENTRFAACLTCFCVRYAMTPGELFNCQIDNVVATAAHALELTFTYQSRSNMTAYLGKNHNYYNDHVAFLTDAQRKAAQATAKEAHRLLTYLTEIS
jgi:hypothetical protein